MKRASLMLDFLKRAFKMKASQTKRIKYLYKRPKKQSRNARRKLTASSKRKGQNRIPKN
jgi:hypothetical protein